MAFLDSIFNPIFLPLLEWNPFLAIVLISFAVTLLITIAYKYLTNQSLMKSLKDQQKEFQQRMKSLRDNPSAMMQVQKEAMKVNMEYMKHSLKPTLITMLPVLLIFGWMAAHLSYEPIGPEARYSVTAFLNPNVKGDVELVVDNSTQIFSAAAQQAQEQVSWNLHSAEGEHLIIVKTQSDTQSIKVLVTRSFEYLEPVKAFQNSDIQKIQVNYGKLRPLGEFSIFGWQPGWLAWYIVLSIGFSIGLRKLMKLH